MLTTEPPLLFLNEWPLQRELAPLSLFFIEKKNRKKREQSALPLLAESSIWKRLMQACTHVCTHRNKNSQTERKNSGNILDYILWLTDWPTDWLTAWTILGLTNVWMHVRQDGSTNSHSIPEQSGTMTEWSHWKLTQDPWTVWDNDRMISLKTDSGSLNSLGQWLNDLTENWLRIPEQSGTMTEWSHWKLTGSLNSLGQWLNDLT